MANIAYISLGGNMGAEEVLFGEALRRIGSWDGVTVGNVSSLYRTEPQGDPGQPWFQNQVAELLCRDVSPKSLLALLLRLETDLGRERDPARRFGPRRVDIDLLMFGSIVCHDEQLILPHPRMAGRAFVLVPLLEIVPNAAFPDGTPLAIALEALEYHVTDFVIYQPERSYEKSK